MKLAAVTLALNDEDIISGTIKCLKPFVDKHVVLISEKPYFGKISGLDRTSEIAEDLGCEVVVGNWRLDHYQRTLGNKMCSDYDWVLGFDSDEMVTKEEMEELIYYMEHTKAPAIAVRPEVYWKTTQYRLDPKPEYTPVIAMKPYVEFTHIRNIDREYEIFNGTMHHLSWCEPKDIYKKVTCYAHASDFNGEEWYADCYLNWVEGEKAKLPDGEYNVVNNPLPDELQRYL